MMSRPTPTPPLKGRGLTLRDEAKRLNTPPLQGRGLIGPRRLGSVMGEATALDTNGLGSL